MFFLLAIVTSMIIPSSTTAKYVSMYPCIIHQLAKRAVLSLCAFAQKKQAAL